MAILRKSTPKKTESRIVPDERDGTIPFVDEAPTGDPLFSSQPNAGESGSEGQLALDVFQTADEIVILAPVAGVKKEDLSINVHRTDSHDEVLTVKGRRGFQFNVESEDYFTQECFWGSFSRSVILPECVDTARIKASFKNGILTVRVPKTERIKMRSVIIKEE